MKSRVTGGESAGADQVFISDLLLSTPKRSSTAEAIRGQLGAQYTPHADEVDAHVRMLDSVLQISDVAVDTRDNGDGHWTVTICSIDLMGGLSLVSGLFAANHLDISGVDVFTLVFESDQPATGANRRSRGGRRGPRSGRPRPRANTVRKILSIFRVGSSTQVLPVVWSRFRDDLAALQVQAAAGEFEAARGRVIDRFSHAMRDTGEAYEQLLPVQVQIEPPGATDAAVLAIQSQDTPGFLFAFTTALGGLKINIQRADVRTVHGRVHDTFWLTGAGGRKITSQRSIRDLRVAAVLIKHFTHILPRSSNPQLALKQFLALVSQVLSGSDWTGAIDALESPEVLETLADMMGVSQFLWEDFLRMQHENLFPVLIDTAALDEVRTRDQLLASIAPQLTPGLPQETRVTRLNRFKDREMFRIDLRHITGRIGFEQFAAELTTLAEVVVARAFELAEGPLLRRFGRPMLRDGAPSTWCVCALGKFGGAELGFGSDVELVLIYDTEGETDGHESVRNSLYYGELVKGFLQTLETRRQGVFEVDLRLRPYGSKGALAPSLAAFEDYYSTGGDARQFERLALVKLRPVAGDAELAAKVVAARDRFVYSGLPLEMDNIRHLRRRQSSELVEPGIVNVKHGLGGLVDVEYYIQACQAAAGAADPLLRLTNTMATIDRLADTGRLGPKRAAEIRAAYGFLRRLIDALRVVRGNARDLSLPRQGSREHLYLAQRLGFKTPDALASGISDSMEYVRGIWD